MKKLFWILMLLPLISFTQNVDFNMKKVTIKKLWDADPKSFKPDFNAHIKTLEPPVPGGHLSKQKLVELKEAVSERYPRKPGATVERGGNRSDDTLAILRNFSTNSYYSDNPIIGGTPNDNTLAISDGGNLITSWNSQLWAYDVEADTFLFAFPIKHPTFNQFVNEYGDTAYQTPFPFDPKLLYDHTRDRFIMVFLVGGAPIPPATQGRNPETSETIVCFSSSSDPKDVWHVYQLDGNPLNYDTWTDYPQIAINENSFYLTLNQLYPDSGWVEGFAETVMWQMDLDAAFNGDAEVPTKFWTGFQYDNKNIRYLHPVKTGMGPQGDSMYFVANRPFVMTNDTFFMVSVTGDADDSSMDMDIQLLPSSLRYGHPPYALQSGANQKFWTNDARVLGAVRMGKEIQFTGNTIDTNTGLATIYHGIIEDIDNPSVSGSIIADSEKELGFPNIAFIGVTSLDRETAIFCNHTGINTDAGNSVVYINNDREYSAVQTVKSGNTYVDMFPGSGDNQNERWGDYTGIQRKFNATSRVWVSGYWGFNNERSGTWVSELATAKDGPLNLTEVEKKNLRVFPNPMIDIVQMEFELEKSTEANIMLHDVQGRLIKNLGRFSIQEGGNRLTFDSSSLKPGVYVITIKESDQVLWQDKLLKQ